MQFFSLCNLFILGCFLSRIVLYRQIKWIGGPYFLHFILRRMTKVERLMRAGVPKWSLQTLAVDTVACWVIYLRRDIFLLRVPGFFVGLRRCPKTSEDVPKTSEDVPKTSEDVPKTSEDVPKTSEDFHLASTSIDALNIYKKK